MALRQALSGKVEGTSDDAAVSKLSAVNLGYLQDPLMSYFVRKSQRRSPLINRGYYARVIAIETVISRFIRLTGGNCQVISLGAGQDTTYFKLAWKGLCAKKWFELDLPDVTRIKTGIIAQNRELTAIVSSENPTEECKIYECEISAHSFTPSKDSSAVDTTESFGGSNTDGRQLEVSVRKVNGEEGCEIFANRYCLLTVDLSDTLDVETQLKKASLDFTLPTLLLSECVLVYMKPEDSCRVIEWAGSNLPRAVFVTYEQIRPNDAFGKVMQDNLTARGASLRGLQAFPDLDSQALRYLRRKWQFASVADMNDVYYKYIEKEETMRAERLEIFDEFEEWHMMMGHYCIAVAINERQDQTEDLRTLLWSEHIYHQTQSDNTLC